MNAVNGVSEREYEKSILFGGELLSFIALGSKTVNAKTSDCIKMLFENDDWYYMKGRENGCSSNLSPNPRKHP